jgi:hypothetical protein
MTPQPELGEQIRQRANFACEYCSTSELDSGGLLTMDHFRPRTLGGGDDLDNLLYCCYRCNLYKGDYWPGQPGDAELWNPRREPMQVHLRLLADGNLYPITSTGELTLQRLRLNRSQLVVRRLRLRSEAEKERRDVEERNLLALFAEIHRQQMAMHAAQTAMLKEQADLLKLLLQERS